MTTSVQAQRSSFTNQLVHGDCIQVMRQMAPESADFILTDPPYLVNYRDRSNRTIQNDASAAWLKPAMREAYRVLKQDRVAIMFYGWTRVDAFFEAWKEAGFQPVGHLVFPKQYSLKSRFFHYQHEQAYLLAKGRPPMPKQPLSDVIAMRGSPPKGAAFQQVRKIEKMAVLEDARGILTKSSHRWCEFWSDSIVRALVPSYRFPGRFP